MKNSVPDRWLEYKAIGTKVAGTRFIAFKTPLKQTISSKLDPRDRFTPEDLMMQCPNLKMVIDLTNTSRYYDKQEFMKKGVEYEKIMCPGRIVPPQALIFRFFDVVDEFYNKYGPEDALIGIHCTHGVNRTGFFIGRYMVQRMGFPHDKALRCIADARGYKIEREMYIRNIRSQKPLPQAGASVEDRAVKAKSTLLRGRLESKMSNEEGNELCESRNLSFVKNKDRRNMEKSRKLSVFERLDSPVQPEFTSKEGSRLRRPSLSPPRKNISLTHPDLQFRGKEFDSFPREGLRKIEKPIFSRLTPPINYGDVERSGRKLKERGNQDQFNFTKRFDKTHMYEQYPRSEYADPWEEKHEVWNERTSQVTWRSGKEESWRNGQSEHNLREGTTKGPPALQKEVYGFRDSNRLAMDLHPSERISRPREKFSPIRNRSGKDVFPEFSRSGPSLHGRPEQFPERRQRKNFSPHFESNSAQYYRNRSASPNLRVIPPTHQKSYEKRGFDGPIEPKLDNRGGYSHDRRNFGSHASPIAYDLPKPVVQESQYYKDSINQKKQTAMETLRFRNFDEGSHGNRFETSRKEDHFAVERNSSPVERSGPYKMRQFEEPDYSYVDGGKFNKRGLTPQVLDEFKSKFVPFETERRVLGDKKYPPTPKWSKEKGNDRIGRKSPDYSIIGAKHPNPELNQLKGDPYRGDSKKRFADFHKDSSSIKDLYHPGYSRPEFEGPHFPTKKPRTLFPSREYYQDSAKPTYGEAKSIKQSDLRDLVASNKDYSSGKKKFIPEKFHDRQESWKAQRPLQNTWKPYSSMRPGRSGF